MAFKTIAHRFGRAYGPDSSSAALQTALARPIHGLETDCCLSSDDQLVLLHDTFLPSCVNLDGWAAERTAREISASFLLDQHGRISDQHPLMLEELLAEPPDVELLQLEVKSTSDSDRAMRTVKVLGEHLAGRDTSRLEVVAFWPEVVRYAASCGLSSRLIVACAYLPSELAVWTSANGVTGIVLEAHYFDAKVVDTWRMAGLSITSGVVNHPEIAERVLEHSPDALCSDRPHELAHELSS